MKLEIPAPMAASAVVVLLVVLVGLILWKSSPHPGAPQPGTVIQAPKIPSGGPQIAPPK